MIILNHIKKYFINKTYKEYYISFKMASGINNLTEKYIQRYDRIKNKYLKKINKTEDQVIIKSYKIITDNIKNTDITDNIKNTENINPKDDNDNEVKPISFYKMIAETEGINTYKRNRSLYLYALNKGNIQKINDEKMKYYDIVYNQDTNTYIRNPENIKPKEKKKRVYKPKLKPKTETDKK